LVKTDMNKLSPAEHDLIGAWVPTEQGVRADDTAERIVWLTKNVLEKVADNPQWGAWETLFRDPDDGRLWERTYPMSETHGGVAPRLTGCFRMFDIRAGIGSKQRSLRLCWATYIFAVSHFRVPLINAQHFATQEGERKHPR
jgi:hypothetical protein